MTHCRSIVRTALGAALVLAALSCAAPAPAADRPWIVDTHAHLANPGPSHAFAPAMATTLARMDAAGIARSILLPPPQTDGQRAGWELDDIRVFAEAHRDRIAMAGGGGSLNGMIQGTPAAAVTDELRLKFRARAEALVAAGAVGFGEVAAHHLSLARMGPNHPYEWIEPDHPLLLLLADIAAETGLPIDLHLDLVPVDMEVPDRPVFNRDKMPSRLKANQPGFERLLDHNRNARIIWAHAGGDILGSRTPEIQRELLTRHPNLFMSLRLGGGSPLPAVALDSQRKLKPSWRALIGAFPERFVIGSDSFHGSSPAGQRGPTDDVLGNYVETLSQLPPDLAEAIGRKNAERLYGLTGR